jgi:hypothetical protein
MRTQRCDFREHRLQRRKAACVDRILVEIGIVASAIFCVFEPGAPPASAASSMMTRTSRSAFS